MFISAETTKIKGDYNMEVIQYQELAARTINPALTHEQMRDHALKGMVGEIGEINSMRRVIFKGVPVCKNSNL